VQRRHHQGASSVLGVQPHGSFQPRPQKPWPDESRRQRYGAISRRCDKPGHDTTRHQAGHNGEDHFRAAHHGERPPGPALDIGVDLSRQERDSQLLSHGPQRLLVSDSATEYSLTNTPAAQRRKRGVVCEPRLDGVHRSTERVHPSTRVRRLTRCHPARKPPGGPRKDRADHGYDDEADPHDPGSSRQDTDHASRRDSKLLDNNQAALPIRRPDIRALPRCLESSPCQLSPPDVQFLVRS